MLKTYHPRVVHSSAFYKSVLLTLVEGLNNRLNDAEIAALLTQRGLLSPSGKVWTAGAVKQALFKILHNKTYPNTLHKALLALCFDGSLSVASVMILFAPRVKHLETM